MRISTLVVLLALFGAAGAHAAARGFTGSLAIQVATLSPIAIPGAGTAIVNGSNGGGPLTALDLPAGVFVTASHVSPFTDPGAAPVQGLRLTVANGGGHFAGSVGSGGFGGSMPLGGVLKVCLFGPCSAAVQNMRVPLSVVGQGGVALVPTPGNLIHTVIGAPWTTGTASIGTITAMGAVTTTTAAMSVRLVTPIFTSGALGEIPMWGFLTLELGVPEPGTLILLGSGVVALVAFGRNRVHR